MGEKRRALYGRNKEMISLAKKWFFTWYIVSNKRKETKNSNNSRSIRAESHWIHSSQANSSVFVLLSSHFFLGLLFRLLFCCFFFFLFLFIFGMERFVIFSFKTNWLKTRASRFFLKQRFIIIIIIIPNRTATFVCAQPSSSFSFFFLNFSMPN